MSVPFFKLAIGDAEMSAVADVMKSGWLTSGPRVREFEDLFAKFIGDDVEAVAVNSATAGLHLAVEACGIGPGDEVIVPTLTFTATAEVVRYTGASVVLVDIDPITRTIDLDLASELVTPRTRAIMPVHFGGLACDMTRVWSFAETRGLHVIEDAAHSLPTRYRGQLIGAGHSAACVFSFYANKTLTTGEGGMLVTRDPKIAMRARLMRTHGLDRDAFDRFRVVGASWFYDVVSPGFKYNMNDMAAALGIAQLARVYELQSSRQVAAERYLDNLAGLPLDLPARPRADDLHAWHLFAIQVWENARSSRDDLVALLAREGIGSSVHYRPLHQMSYWRDHGGLGDRRLPVADRYYAGAMSLPLFPNMSPSEVDAVCDVIRLALG